MADSGTGTDYSSCSSCHNARWHVDCNRLISPVSNWESALQHLRLSREEEREVVEEAESKIGGVGEQLNRSEKVEEDGLFQSVLKESQLRLHGKVCEPTAQL